MNGVKSAPVSLASSCGSSRSRTSLQAHCNAPAGHANWLASARSPRQTPTWWNGITVASRGKLTSEIQEDRPDWELFRDGCPGGESPQDVARRADRFISRVLEVDGDVLAFSSGHIIRMIAARWLGLPPAGRFFYCRPASVGVLDFEHDSKDEPIIGLWNFVRQLNE